MFALLLKVCIDKFGARKLFCKSYASFFGQLQAALFTVAAHYSTAKKGFALHSFLGEEAEVPSQGDNYYAFI